MRLSKRGSAAPGDLHSSCPGGNLGRRAAVAACAVVALVSLAGCGTKTISGDDAASQVSSKLQAQVGQKPDKVTCPDLKAEKGSTITCTLTDGAKKYDVKVDTTSVDGDKVKFDIKVADTPKN